MVFGLFGKKEEEEEVEIEPVSFQGPMSGQEVNLKANTRLVEAGLMPAKDLVTDALARRADALRIDPKGPQAAVTISVDGIPYPGGKLSKTEGLAVTQMLKLLAGLDIKERTSPQSGTIKAEFDSRPYRLDLHAIPTPLGERLIVRATDLKQKLDTPDQLGMGEELRVKLRDLCASPGMLLVVGPAGSGVTTTLFGLVRNVDSYIYTVYTIAHLDGRKLNHVTALEAQEGDDLATTLGRAIRMEANIVLCDPLKNADTAKHMLYRAEDIMLLAEMPSRDTPSALLQLITWSPDPQAVAANLKGIVTQKLIRVLCPDCKQAYRPKGEFLKKLGLPADTAALYRKPPDGDGKEQACEKCGGEGYFGRTAMFEFLEVTDGMKELITGNPDANTIRVQMKKDKATTLHVDGLRLIAEGVTSLEELQRLFKPAG